VRIGIKNEPKTASPNWKLELSSIPTSFSSNYENPIVIAITPIRETIMNNISTLLNFSPIHKADKIIVAIGERFLATP
jgi:hypothetical protein